MIRRFQRTRTGRQLRKLYMKQRGRLNYLLVKTVFRGRMLARKRQFADNLVLLHDALEASDLAGRYWIWGGLLLGWAREGGILDHDSQDADFAFLAPDRQRFLNSLPSLMGAGFQPSTCLTNNESQVTEYTFAKDDAKFEFFEMREEGDSIGFFTYSGRARLQTTNAVPRHGLQAAQFLDRTWLVPEDHDSYLTHLYGNWRKPDPSWDWLEDDKSIQATTPWTGSVLPFDEGLIASVDGARRQTGSR